MQNRLPLFVAALVGAAILTTQTSAKTSTTKGHAMQTEPTSSETKGDEQQSFAELKAIEKALAPYIESAKTGEGARTEAAFMDHAHIVGTVGGTHYNMDLKTFSAAVTEGGPSPAVQHHIAWIDVSGPAAAARVEFLNWGGLRYTDFFVLFKKDGEWKISGKVYDSHSNN